MTTRFEHSPVISPGDCVTGSVVAADMAAKSALRVKGAFMYRSQEKIRKASSSDVAPDPRICFMSFL